MSLAVPVRIPSPLRPFTGGQNVVEVFGSTVAEALAALGQKHAELDARLRDGDGRLRGHVRVFLNDEDVRFLEDGRTPLRPGDTLAIVPAIAGG